MAIKDLVANLIDQKLIKDYQVKAKQNNEWLTIKCKLKNKGSMIISKLDETETKEDFQNQFKEYLSANEIRIIAYYTSEPNKIVDWVENRKYDEQSLLIVCLNEAKERKFLTKLQEIINQ